MIATGLVAALLLAASTDATNRPEMADCGPMSLALLLRLEGISGEPRAIMDHLPPRPSGGYSMLELREAARPLGMNLTGVRIVRGGPTPDRPIIALLDKKPDGHFVVVRPVGRTGKLVQVIDPAGQLEVLDASALYASPEWTGLTLMPSRPNWPLRVGIALGVGALLTLARSFWLKVPGRGTGGSGPG